MEISVIIPTYNRAARIGTSLTALANQTIRNFEVVVVVDGSTDHTLEVVEQYRNKFHNLRVVQIPNSGRARARNKGAAEASGAILVFIDDDVRLQKEAVWHHLQFHEKHPGQMTFGHLELDPLLCPGDDFWQYRRYTEATWRKNQEQEITLERYAFTSANCSLSQTTFGQIGGFDPDLKDSEDFDFSVRALLKKIPIKFNPVIKGYHDDMVSISQHIHRQQEYMLSKHILLRKHPEYQTLLQSQFEWMRPRASDFLKRLVFKDELRWTRFFSTRFFLLFPAPWRYKVYSAFLFTQSVLRTR